MRRGEIYRTKERSAERGAKPGFYIVVSRDFVAQNLDISTVICAPVYSEILGIHSEVILDETDGMPRECAIRCDFLMLMFKKKLTQLVATLRIGKLSKLNSALAYALQLDLPRANK